MSEQPQALRLAEKLLSPAILYSHDRAQIAVALRRLHDELDCERSSRQAAQAENEALKARLARAGVERQQAVLTKDALLRQALEALKDAEKDAADFQRINTDQTSAAITAIRQHLEPNQ